MNSARPRITIVAAVADNSVIGREGELPWHLPADLAFFKETTKGGTVIMGRKTFDSIAKALPGRRNIVITRNEGWSAEGVEVACSLEQAAGVCGADECFVLGGSTIYELALPIADRMVITHVHASPQGDTRFPDWDKGGWRIEHEMHHAADDRNEHAMTFTEYVRN
jgi:dihydrofolate reductase